MHTSLHAPGPASTATDASSRRARHRWSPAWLVVLGPLLGAAVGVVARGWMRLITDDPEFTWSGTIFIVLAFTIAGLGQGIAWSARSARASRSSGSRRRRTTVARVVGAALTLPLFGGAGSIMLPTVAGASLYRWRPDWPRPVRLLVAALAVPAPIALIVEAVRDGLSPRSVAGLALLAATYTLIVASMRSIIAPIDDGWRMPRALRAVLVVVAVLAFLGIAMMTVGVATA